MRILCKENVSSMIPKHFGKLLLRLSLAPPLRYNCVRADLHINMVEPHRPFLCSSETTIVGFWDSKIVECLVVININQSTNLVYFSESLHDPNWLQNKQAPGYSTWLRQECLYNTWQKCGRKHRRTNFFQESSLGSTILYKMAIVDAKIRLKWSCPQLWFQVASFEK